MSGYTLKIIRNGSERTLPATTGKTLTVPVEYQTLYQIHNPKGELVPTPQVREHGMDLWVYLGRTAEGAPDVILQNYLLNYPVVDLNQLAQAGTTFATAAPPAYAESAALTATHVGKVHAGAVIPTGLFGALGALSLAGLAVAASGGKGGGDDKQEEKKDPPQPPQPPADKHVNTPTVTIENIGDINKANQNQSVTLRGKLDKVDTDVVATTVTVNINGKDYAANVSSNKQNWTLDTTNTVLSTKQGTNNISVSAHVKDGANNEATSSKAQATYQVDTVLDKPVVNINAISEVPRDDKGQTKVTGTITGLASDTKVNEVVVQVGNKNVTATVGSDGKTWSAQVSNSDLLAQDNRQLKAVAKVSDTGGNSESGSAQGSYKVADIPQPPQPPADKHVNTPTVTIENIGNINKANQNQSVTLRGKLDKVDTDVVATTVTVNINGKDHVANVSSDKTSWTLNTTNTVLSTKQGANNISVSAHVKDGANNEATSSKAQATYQVDTVLDKPVVNINAISEVSRDETGQTKVTGTISGLANDTKVNEVVVQVGNKNVTATVGSDGKTWSAQVSNSDLLAQDNRQLKAVAKVSDTGGNSESGSAQGSYKVADIPQPPQPPADKHVNTPTVTIENIGNINKANQSQNVTLRGALGKIDTDVVATTVTVNINGKDHVANVSSDKTTWTFNTTNTVLSTKQGANNISVSAHVKDGANNEATSSKAQATYQVDTVLDKPVVNINAISEVPRDEKGQTKVTGTITGLANDTKVNEVVVQVGNKNVAATVGSDGKTWSAQVSNSDLLAQDNRQLKAVAKVSDTGGNSESGSAQGSYKVAKVVEPEVGIRITGIDGDNVVGSDRNPVLVRIKGTVDASKEPLFAQVQNHELLQSIELKLNGKSYEAGLSDSTDGRNYTFTAYVPAADLRAANGQNFTYSFNYAENDTRSVVRNTGYVVNNVKLTEDFVAVTRKPNKNNVANFRVTLEGEGVSAAGGKYRVDSTKLSANESTVNGKVYGEAKEGDAVEVSVNGKSYRTTVKAGQTFDVTVPTAELLADQTHHARATLTAQRGGKTLTAQDNAVYLGGKAAHAGQATPVKHETDNSKLPYFIENLRAEWAEDDDHHHGPTAYVGYLEDHPVGEAIEVRYRFFSQNEINQLNQTIQDLKRKWFTLPINNLQERFVLQHHIEELEQVRDKQPVAYSDTVQAKMKEMLKHISKHANVRFTQVNSPDEQTDLVFFMHDTDDADGFAYYGGHVHLSKSSFSGVGRNGEENFNFTTALHETLHSLGMKHPHKDEHESADVPLMKENEDHKGLTVMSYNFEDFMETKAMRMFDLAYLHYRFGVNADQRSGNDVYTFKPFNRYSLGNDVYIWDGGGVDTFDASTQEQGVTVNLTPGSWIHAGNKASSFAVLSHTQLTEEQLAGSPGKTVFNGDYFFNNTFAENQAFIGYGTQIENLIGSKHNDVLKGNKADNAIYGGAGNDVISGDDGDDWLDGGAGNDVLAGGKGNDTYIVGEMGDQVVGEAAKGGNDHVYSSVDYTLGNHLENLTLLGAALKGMGNALNNQLTGNNLDNTLNGGAGNDVLKGGGGKDVLTGGTGNDQFVFSSLLDGTVDEITDFKAGEDKIVLSRSVFTALRSESDIANHIRYDSAGGVLSYDADGAGNGAAMAFAKVKGLDEDLSANILLVA